MSTPILATKLYIPLPRPTLVRRPRLLARLNAALQHKVTLISAPAGYGKTTLVSSWIHQKDAGGRTNDELRQTTLYPSSLILHPSSVAWLSLDEGDSDPTRFLTYFVASLQTLTPQLGAGMLALLQSPQPPPMAIMLTALVNEMATLPDQIILILDDYHLIDAAPTGGGLLGAPLGAVDQALTFLIEHLPPQMHLVITTREDPQLPLARLRARGELNEVRAADLRFTAAEATDFLNQMMGLNLATEQIAALSARTEGWIAGIQLAALSLRGREDIPGFIRAFTGDNRYIVDYLVEEVLQRQSAPVRTFLLQTSILDRLCGPLCAAVTNQAESSATLERLERGNLFVIPLDDRRHWFRYHHLFADLLHTHLLAQLPDQVPILHRRASEWYEAQGGLSDAIRHAFAADDMGRAARLIEREWRNHHRSQFRSAAVIDWMKRLPEAMVRANPSLSTGFAWELLNNGEMEAAESRLCDAERALDKAVGGEQAPTLSMDIANARAYLALGRDDLPGAIAHGQRAIELCPADDLLARALVEALLGLVKMATGDLAGAYHSLAAAQRGVQQAGNILFAIGMTYALADICVAQGRLRAAIQIYDEALLLAGVDQTAPQANPILQGTADLYLGLGDLHHELGNWAAAHENLQKSEGLGEALALPNWSYRMKLVQTRIKQSEGDFDGALKRIDEAEKLYYRSPVPEVRPLAALKARIWIAQGKLDEATHWAHERGLVVEDDLSFVREFEHVTLARLLIARYQQAPDERVIGDAMGLLARLLLAAEEGERMSSVIEILLLQALAQYAQGDDARAFVPLERALTLAEPEGFVRIFVAEGAPMQHLLSQTKSHGIAERYIHRLLAGFPNTGIESIPQSAIRNPQSKMVEPLSQRELEVLQLIAQGFSNQEIGAQLFLALDTVKGHNRRIFDKLQVQRRTEAVAKARALNLLSRQ